MKSNASVLKIVIFTCLYLILVTPLLVWGKFLFPYITPKAFFFRILVEIALFCYILLAVYRPEYRPRFSKVTWIVFVYFLVMTLASLLGVDLYRSFWGNIERGEGLLTIYHLFAFFILITSVFKEKKDWFRFFKISVFVSLVVSLYALGQNFQLGFLLTSAGGSRLTGTIGNASFLAAYLLMSIFLCLFLFVNEKNLKWRVFYGITFLFQTYILFKTETRGALLAFFGGLLLLAIFNIIFSDNKKLKLKFVFFFLALILVSTTVWISKDQAWVKNNNALRRLTSISVTNITAQTRLLGWQAAWRGWNDRFIFGYGYENYNVAFNKYFPAAIYLDAGSRVWFDRAHNIFFDQAVAGGLLGIMAYLSMFGIGLWILWSILRSRQKKQRGPPGSYNQMGFIVLIAFLASYFVQNLFVFDTMGTYLLFYSVLGFLSYLSLTTESVKEEDKRIQTNSGSQPRVLLVSFLALALILSVYVFNVKPAMSNTLSIKGMSYAYGNMYREAMVYFKKSLSTDTYQAPEIRHNLSRTVGSALRSGQFTQDESITNFEYAIEEMNKNIELSPLNARHYFFTMHLYNEAANLTPIYYEKVIEMGYKALKLSPTRPQIYHLMGQARISQGRFQEGIDFFQKAVDLNPTTTESRWNLAAAYIIADQNQLADEQFTIMEELGFKYYSMANLQRLVRPYLIRSNFNQIVVLYEEMIKLQPANVDLYTKLAAAYGEIGEIDLAKQAVQAAVELNPDLAETAAAFLQLLEAAR